MPRWVCPNCGQAVNAPQRPRRDDVRRYCLTCSAQTGRLVERAAPALERKRAARREAQATKRKARAERERLKSMLPVVAHSGSEHLLNVEGTVEWLCKRAIPRYHPPEVSWSRRAHSGSVGRANWSRITMRFEVNERGASLPLALALIVHETAHSIHQKRDDDFIGTDSQSGEPRWHNREWRHITAELGALMGADVNPGAENRYEAHSLIVRAMREADEAGTLRLPKRLLTPAVALGEAGV